MLLVANNIQIKLYEHVECIRHCAKNIIGEQTDMALATVETRRQVI